MFKSLGGLVALATPSLARQVVRGVGIVTLLGREALLDAVTSGTVRVSLAGTRLDLGTLLSVTDLVLPASLLVGYRLGSGLALPWSCHEVTSGTSQGDPPDEQRRVR